ncbi:MAG: hypothetical protein GY808_11940 [Gammaproteobacteria bacterium]|nr:hypothetical protein [Gammaproteobacteria bacterium]
MQSIFKVSILVILFLTSTFTTSFAQFPWTKHAGNPIFSDTTGSWAMGFAFAPYVMIIDSTYHMWYCGMDNVQKVRIGYATSSDGISWEPYANNPVLDVPEEQIRVSDPTVIYDG